MRGQYQRVVFDRLTIDVAFGMQIHGEALLNLVAVASYLRAQPDYCLHQIFLKRVLFESLLPWRGLVYRMDFGRPSELMIQFWYRDLGSLCCQHLYLIN